MKIQFLGATGTVTGSKYLVRLAGSSLLVDCGLFQGYKQLRLRNWAEPPFDPSRIDAVVLTHAHIDHSGYLPLFVKKGFQGKVYCSEATRDLCRVLLPDSAHLQEEEADYANRHGYSKHSPALPLYTRKDAELALRRLVPVAFRERFEAARGVVARLEPAGHILGAAIVVLEDADGRVVFTGDLGRPNDAIMMPPARIDRADVLVLESTYGDRRHEETDPAAQLGRIVAQAAAHGGVVVVPAFAVGRAQALLHYLQELKASGAIPAALPVYVDSPMATSVTSIYLAHRGEHRLSEAQCHAMEAVATFVGTPDESRRLDESSWPMVIIAGSGMATGGRVLHHLKRFAPDPRTAIVLAGYQAGGTRGAALAQGAREVKIHGQYVPVRATVHNLGNLSAHADYAEILDWLRGFERAPARTYLTHGEPDAADALRRRIEEALGWRVRVPDYLETVDAAVAGVRDPTIG
ncbi:MAG: MBL fold metallo-hydrolase [Usitatibacter sp.]